VRILIFLLLSPRAFVCFWSRFQSSLSPSRRSALVAELSSKESSLSLLVQTYAALLENVSPAERANHKAIFDEFEQTKDELEKEIAAIKKQIA